MHALGVQSEASLKCDGTLRVLFESVLGNQANLECAVASASRNGAADTPHVELCKTDVSAAYVLPSLGFKMEHLSKSGPRLNATLPMLRVRNMCVPNRISCSSVSIDR